MKIAMISLSRKYFKLNLNPDRQGYDVWLGNVRGNIYCLNHTTLTPKDRKFWDFSFQEMGEIDLPAMVDYVLKVRFEFSEEQLGSCRNNFIIPVF